MSILIKLAIALFLIFITGTIIDGVLVLACCYCAKHDKDFLGKFLLGCCGVVTFLINIAFRIEMFVLIIMAIVYTLQIVM